MRLKTLSLAGTIAVACTLAGCTPRLNRRRPPPRRLNHNNQPPWSLQPQEPSATSSGSVVGTVVRFTAGTETLDMTEGEDNPAARDFLGMLPLTLTLEEFGGREKIADLPRELSYQGSPGSDPQDGDLIYYTPWQNLGFYYNASGVCPSEQTIHIGRYDATAEELARFEGQNTTVEIVQGQ